MTLDHIETPPSIASASGHCNRSEGEAVELMIWANMSADREADDGDNGRGGVDGGSGSGNASEEPARPRPQARTQVSFRLPRPTDHHDNDDDDRSTHSDRGRAADPPRNRRRLFRDTSYTTRATRRDQMPGGLGNRRPRPAGDPAFRDSMTESNASDPRANFAGQPRREQSFRGRPRRDSSGRAGGISARFRTLGREMTQRFNMMGTSEREPTTEQYHIPPPEESNYSVLEVFGQLYSMACGDVAMWVYGAAFGKVLVFFLILYLAFVYFFVVILFLVDWIHLGSACINGINDFDAGNLSTKQHFEFAFELSWTTVS